MFGKSYTKQLLKTGSIEAFVAGINAEPGKFFKEAEKKPKETLRSLATVIDMAGSNLGQSAVVLSLIGTLKIAAKDKRAPKNAPEIAKKMGEDLLRIFKSAS